MNSELEGGLKTWLAAEGIVVPLFTGLTGETLPSSQQTLTTSVSDSERATGPLYRATCNFIIATPPDHNGAGHAASLADHRATVETVRALLEDHDQTTIKTTIENETDLFFHGGFLRSAGEAKNENGQWVTSLEFVAGIATVDLSAWVDTALRSERNPF